MGAALGGGQHEFAEKYPVVRGYDRFSFNPMTVQEGAVEAVEVADEAETVPVFQDQMMP